jgi:hypothetical protein
MCFCFDGANALAAFRPETCRERSPDASIFGSLPIAPGGEPDQLSAAASFEVAEAGHAGRLAVAPVSGY